ncbi:MAG: dihydroorotate dehydrogenase electron transfer subunit [Desulfovibrio sp.]|jgi:dihydroorotate dehydrogenase electron transfer subunit|nr:dihydroorotate dehydrogenase electron transfer subunit [Desulfovibrio sp.]
MVDSSYCRLPVLGLTPFNPHNGQARFFALRLPRPPGTAWESWRPGQFVMLRPDSFGLELPWGRPLCICHVTDCCLTCFFQVRGRGTRRMAHLRPGDMVGLWGPLGNGFAKEEDAPVLLLAGGMGIAPFVGYVNTHPKPWNVSMLFGHREPLESYPVNNINEFVPLDCFWEREPGDLRLFLQALEERMSENARFGGLALACGPLPFLQAVRELGLKLQARVQLSLESVMACGVGACLGCVTPAGQAWPEPGKRGRPVQVCRRGPVFWVDQVEL